jgi:uncharacterized phage protein (TIGR02220 family)
VSDEKREFRGIWFPASVWLDSDLSAIEKFVLMEIDSLDGEDGCYASNDYLAGFCQCSTRTVSQSISKLKALGYIEVKSFDGRKRVLRSCLAKSARQTRKICEADSQNLRERILDKVSSTEKDSMSEKKSDAFESDLKAIVDHLNAKVGSRYTTKNKQLRGYVHARLSEGFTVGDFLTVIDNKVAKWGDDPKMRDYLRPSTLFAPSHFEEYLNESPHSTSILDTVDWAKYELKPF